MSLVPDPLRTAALTGGNFAKCLKGMQKCDRASDQPKETKVRSSRLQMWHGYRPFVPRAVEADGEHLPAFPSRAA